MEPKIVEITSSVLRKTSQSSTYYDVIRSILTATVTAIKYDFNAVNKSAVDIMRASDAVESGKGVCQHFAAVFVAVARSIGLPARVIHGFLLSQEDGQEPNGGAHAWVEVLVDGKSWLPLEPQTDRLLFLPGPKYLPLGISIDYESIDGRKDLGALYAQYKTFRNFHLVHLAPTSQSVHSSSMPYTPTAPENVSQ